MQTPVSPMPDAPPRTDARVPTLRGRVSRVLAALLLVVVTIATLGWMHETRRAIHEEINAASRVAELR